MSAREATIATQEQRELLCWTASLGAITAEALAVRRGDSLASARARLSALCRRGLLSRKQLLSARPALYTLTAAGRRAVGLGAQAGCSVSPSNANHLIACAQVAASLERCYPGQRVLGEHELRAGERACGRPQTVARLATGLHRPDMVLLAPVDGRSGRAPARALPVAVEVELTDKAPRRLRAICRAWARCPQVAGVLYLTSARVEPALVRAVQAARAQERIAVVPLAALPGWQG
jgi:hypothetical protein